MFPLLFGPGAPESPRAAFLWDAPVAGGVGCPRYRVSAAERVPAARHSQASAREAEPGARRPLARPRGPPPAPAALACAPPAGAAPSLRAPGLCELPGPDGGAGGSGAPALGRPFPELARPG